MRKLLWPVITFLLASAVLSTGVWWWAYDTALDRLSARGQTELSLAADRLQSYLQRFRQLSVILADHPSLVALLEQDGAPYIEGAEKLLLEAADKTGSGEVFILSSQGVVVASSSGSRQNTDHSQTDYFRRAMHGALGTSQGANGFRRAFFAAAPILQDGRPPIGAVVVKVDIEAVETDWRANSNILFFTDRLGVIFVANRFELLFKRQHDRAIAQDPSQKYHPGVVQPFPSYQHSSLTKHDVWQFPRDNRFPASALHLVAPAPVIDLDAQILIDAAPARLTALLQGSFALAACWVIGAVFLILGQRRLALADRLHIEERANQQLEARVTLRTEQLSGVNLDLRQQIKERREAEEALKVAQQDLVQAGKLSALGQMSAGISHELNQPLMAIRSFAENAETFLERGDAETAKRNLARISDLARRMGRIIKNLRAFTRKEGEKLTDVNLIEVIDLALEMNEQRLVNEQVSVVWQAPEAVVLVRGGEVRLQQVLVNLLSNGIDAMEGRASKVLDITVAEMASKTVLSIRDTGPGLDDAGRIFDPFYTTKAVGASEGMGLGLSISYGIVQSFGGKIVGRNHPDGGAEFTIELARAPLQVAA
ncbi:MAG: two-component system C4-dicarboxylate transport sensor histidine kinase DctB [Paracoccaceae bacterium]|jgi:two-component system C4-dicarboxylate transport sensor histidine kinase DctB